MVEMRCSSIVITRGQTVNCLGTKRSTRHDLHFAAEVTSTFLVQDGGVCGS